MSATQAAIEATKLTFKFDPSMFGTKKQLYIATAMGSKIMAAAVNDTSAMGKDIVNVVKSLDSADPTKNKEYLQYICNMYRVGQFKLEDIDRLKGDLEVYHKAKPRLAPEERNITSFKELKELYAVVDRINNSADGEDLTQSKAEQERIIKANGVVKLFDTPQIKVMQLESEHAAKFYGKGTRWCTAAEKDNRFEYYDKQGKLYVIIVGDRKFQLHVESGQFMDEQDQNVGKKDIDLLSSIQEYTDFLNMLIKKHYGVG